MNKYNKEDNYEDLEKVIIDGKQKDTMAALGRMEKEGLNEVFPDEVAPLPKGKMQRQKSAEVVSSNSGDHGEHSDGITPGSRSKQKMRQSATGAVSNAVSSSNRRSEEKDGSLKSAERKNRATMIIREQE